MERRALRYTDGSSDKFWRISLDGSAHTVCYGRVGTSGKTQMKEFDSAEAAKKSFEKLVKAKLKKGYTDIPSTNLRAAATSETEGVSEKLSQENTVALEVTQSAGKAKGPVPKDTLPKDAVSKDAVESARSKSAKSKSSKAEVFEIKRKINLGQKDWQQANWRSKSPPTVEHDEEIQQRLDTWKPYPGGYHVMQYQGRHVQVEEAIALIFSLGSAQKVKENVQRFGLAFPNPEAVYGWLAHTEFDGLEYLCHSLIRCNTSWRSAPIEPFLDSVQAPESAPYVLEIWLSVKKAKFAREWLENNLTEAVVGLIPVAVGDGHTPLEITPKAFSEAALDFLRGVKRKGHDALLEFAVAREDEETAAKIREWVLDVKEIPCFDEENVPDWLASEVLNLPALKKKIDWVSPAELPDIVVGEYRLNAAQVQSVLNAIKLSSLESPLPLVSAIKQQATTESVDEFAWSLFERWMTEGGDSKEKWAMHGLGMLGSDAIALKLTPIIRKWPGESQHGKAREGLNCLRAIGSDTALMQINGIAQKIKYKALKKRAQECMSAIAEDLHLTTEQLEDRIIPDCGLDEKGKRVFDFGPRQFQFALGGDLKPFVRDAQGKTEGKLRSNLPKPNQKDDAEMAKQAAADWKLMKKQIASVVKLQATRLETAMVLERRWPIKDFQTLLVAHPLMIHLVQRVVWAGYDKKGDLVQTFRVAEDCSFADDQDEEVALETVVEVGAIHPLQLSPESREDWGEAFSDYEIMPPFPQLDREVYTLTKAEENAEELERFVSVKVSGSALARLIEKQGWLKGALHDHGDYSVHYKYFEASDLTAVVGDYEQMFVQYVDGLSGGDEAINACLFLEGKHSQIYDYPKKGSWYSKQLKAKCQTLGTVPPLVMSEVIRDLSIVAMVQVS